MGQRGGCKQGRSCCVRKCRNPPRHQLAQVVRNRQRYAHFERHVGAERPGDLQGVQRVATGCGSDAAKDRLGEAGPDVAFDQNEQVVDVDRPETQVGGAVVAECPAQTERIDVLGGQADRGHDADSLARDAPGGEGERVRRCRVEPADVVDDDESRPALSELFQQAGQGHTHGSVDRGHAPTATSRAAWRRRVPPAGRRAAPREPRRGRHRPDRRGRRTRNEPRLPHRRSATRSIHASRPRLRQPLRLPSCRIPASPSINNAPAFAGEAVEECGCDREFVVVPDDSI